jgi:hypothetical protein
LPDLRKNSVATLGSRNQSCHTQAQEIKKRMKKKASPAAARKTPAKEIHRKAADAPARATFPIVGIGASAADSKPWISS